MSEYTPPPLLWEEENERCESQVASGSVVNTLVYTHTQRHTDRHTDTHTDTHTYFQAPPGGRKNGKREIHQLKIPKSKYVLTPTRAL